MNKRKLLALVLTGVMAISTLAGCGSSDTKTSDTDVKASETAETSDKNVLRVGMECAYAPFNWTQDTDTTPDGSKAVKIAGSDYYAYGYDVAVAQKLADQMGMDLEVSGHQSVSHSMQEIMTVSSPVWARQRKEKRHTHSQSLITIETTVSLLRRAANIQM